MDRGRFPAVFLKRQDLLVVAHSLALKGSRVDLHGRQVDRQPISVAEVKNVWSCASAFPVRLYVVHRQILTYL